VEEGGEGGGRVEEVRVDEMVQDGGGNGLGVGARGISACAGSVRAPDHVRSRRWWRWRRRSPGRVEEVKVEEGRVEECEPVRRGAKQDVLAIGWRTPAASGISACVRDQGERAGSANVRDRGACARDQRSDAGSA
jgi:hypothetical protein